MVVNRAILVNECGLPLNDVEWLKTHHRSKFHEREQMVRDLDIQPGSFMIDAGCGPGLWTPMLAKEVGDGGCVLGVDISTEALITAQRFMQAESFRDRVQFKKAPLDVLPAPYGSVDLIFGANVSMYLADPVGTFQKMGRYLRPGGRLAIKDVDSSTFRFSFIEDGLLARVMQARRDWDCVRALFGYAFEDSWIGSKLAGYLEDAGYQDIEVRTYTIERHATLSPDCRVYLQGIGEWFVSEGVADTLRQEDVQDWLNCFFATDNPIWDRDGFCFAETEYLVSGTWPHVLPSYYCLGN